MTLSQYLSKVEARVEKATMNSQNLENGAVVFDVPDHESVMDLSNHAPTDLARLVAIIKIQEERLDWIYTGCTGMFGHPGETHFEEFYKLTPRRIEETKSAVEKLAGDEK